MEKKNTVDFDLGSIAVETNVTAPAKVTTLKGMTKKDSNINKFREYISKLADKSAFYVENEKFSTNALTSLISILRKEFTDRKITVRVDKNGDGSYKGVRVYVEFIQKDEAAQ